MQRDGLQDSHLCVFLLPPLLPEHIGALESIGNGGIHINERPPLSPLPVPIPEDDDDVGYLIYAQVLWLSVEWQVRELTNTSRRSASHLLIQCRFQTLLHRSVLQASKSNLRKIGLPRRH